MIDKILKTLDINATIKEISVKPFVSSEDGSDYNTWLLSYKDKRYVLKKAKNFETEIYANLLKNVSEGAPKYVADFSFDNEQYLIIEYIDGTDLCKCTRDSLIKAIDALIAIQEQYWNDTAHQNVGFSFDKSLKGRIKRGEYLGDTELEAAYSEFISLYSTLPRTLCHDDLLPFNVIVGKEKAYLIDWEYAGILPYPTSISRLIAHAEEGEEAFFYMSDEDKAFAIDYYYKSFIKGKRISYNDYIKAIDSFLLYEYCEWIMLGNRYENSDKERARIYFEKAKAHLNK